MSVVLLMIPISLLLSLGFVGAFIWSTKKGQFDHIDLEAYRLLNDNEITKKTETLKTKEEI